MRHLVRVVALYRLHVLQGIVVLETHHSKADVIVLCAKLPPGGINGYIQWFSVINKGVGGAEGERESVINDTIHDHGHSCHMEYFEL